MRPVLFQPICLYFIYYNQPRQYQFQIRKIMERQQARVILKSHDFLLSINFHVKFGEAIYVVGSVESLGNWNIKNAIRLDCIEQNGWFKVIQVPMFCPIQYKYFVSRFNAISEQNIYWIGKQNSLIQISKQNLSKLQDKKLTLMSFNLRYENTNDKGQYSWKNRRENCKNLIVNYFPAILGVQQALTAQRQYLVQNLNQNYNYFGIARDLKKGQQCGIFVRKDRFVVVEYGFEWMSESREAGSIGYDASLPRYFTFIILLDMKHQQSRICVINTHLDHQGRMAQKKGIQIIFQKITYLTQKYKIKNTFIMGDFNTNQNDKIFNILKDNENMPFNSLRDVSPQTNKSLTFNNFSGEFLQTFGYLIANQSLTIDHFFAYLQDYQPVLFDVIKIKDKILSDHFPIFAALE